MHQSENLIPLKVRRINGKISEVKPVSGNVEFIILPYYKSIEAIPSRERLYSELNDFLHSTEKNATIAVLTSPIFATDFCSQLNNDIHLKLWITVKLENPIAHKDYLTEQHSALLIFTKHKESLKHTKTRIGYTYCPCCDKTTKRLRWQETFVS